MWGVNWCCLLAGVRVVWVELELGGVSTFLVEEQGAGREGRWTEALGPSIDTLA